MDYKDKYIELLEEKCMWLQEELDRERKVKITFAPYGYDNTHPPQTIPCDLPYNHYTVA